jgi:hypothetical protein
MTQLNQAKVKNTYKNLSVLPNVNRSVVTTSGNQLSVTGITTSAWNNSLSGRIFSLNYTSLSVDHIGYLLKVFRAPNANSAKNDHLNYSTQKQLTRH